MNIVRVFVSFDVEHDQDLFELILEQSREPTSGFSVLGGSKRSTTACLTTESVRRRVRDADQVIVICGKHTESSAPVSSELLIAVEEGIPHFLLWGRRDSLCTKPSGAKPSEGMYGWTRHVFQEQLAFASRRAATDAAASILRDAQAKR